MTKTKQSNFELLKVLAMLMIVSHHLVTLNAFNVDTDLVGLDRSRVFLQLIGNHAFIGNNLFFMISAWFLCLNIETSDFKRTVGRIWRIEQIMLFYSIFIPVIFNVLSELSPMVAGGGGFSVKSLFPLSLGLWWYPTAYAIFLIFFPFYQQGLQSLDRKELRNLIFAMLAIWTIPTIIPVKLYLGADNVTCFFMLYAIIFYVRKFQPEWSKDRRILMWLMCGGYLLAFASILFLDFIGTRSAAINENACYYIRGNWRLLPVIIAVSMFLLFSQMKIGYSRVINWLGSVTFSVYLIHMHPLMIDLLFKKLFVLTPYLGSWRLIPYVIGVTLLIFIISATIEQVRKWIYLPVELIWRRIRYNCHS